MKDQITLAEPYWSAAQGREKPPLANTFASSTAPRS